MGFCKFIVQVAQLKYTKTFIKTILYNFNNSIVSALNFNILKTNLSKIASKEVKIYVFQNYFLKKKSCAIATAVIASVFFSSCLSVSGGKDILFCNFWRCVGLCELQMCMAFSVGIVSVIRY